MSDATERDLDQERYERQMEDQRLRRLIRDLNDEVNDLTRSLAELKNRLEDSHERETANHEG